MKKSRFTESQIVAILKVGEAGLTVAEIARKHGISKNTYFNWKSRYGGVFKRGNDPTPGPPLIR